MASNLSYLKGVRTRYINILEKEMQCGSDILASDLELIDKTELTLSVNKCVERLQLYCDKVENQTDKLAEAIGNKDTDLSEQLVTENASICDKAMEYAINLKQLKDEISLTKTEAAETMEKVGMSHIVELQKQMNAIVGDQMRQQHDFLEKQDKKEKELATTVKLPKIEIMTFSGNKLKWTEFWDSFECAIHNNKKLSNIEKFNYLKSKVIGEARSAISGLTLSNENYIIAVDILRDRFGNSQEVIDLHYNKMITLQPAFNRTCSLRSLLDTMETHIRSLEVLKQDINQDVFVSMIRSKLPEEVRLQLEILNGAKNKWTVESLRAKLHEYVTAREHAEKKGHQTDGAFQRSGQFRSEGNQRFGPTRNGRNNHQRSEGRTFFSSNTSMRQTGSGGANPHTGSAEALVVNTKQSSVTRYYDQCRYCEQRHWSDECPKYRTVEERKRQLKDSCYKCLKTGHMSKDCKRSKACVHCGEVNSHHRSLCPKKYKATVSNAHLIEKTDELKEVCVCAEENVLVSSGEMVLMQTAKAEIMNPNKHKSDLVRILLDSGSQRTYVTETLAEKLQLTRENEEEIKLVTFMTDKPQTVKTTQTKLSIKLNNGQHLDISANIVPVISGTVQRKALKLFPSKNLDHLVRSLEMADTIPSETESSAVELLIGSDYYLDIILSQKIEVQPGLYLLASKLGWILTGRTSEADSPMNESNMLILTYGTNATKTNVFTSLDDATASKPDLEDFWNTESIGVYDNPKTTNDEIVMKNFKDTIKFEDGRYQVTWPWKDETPDLPVNRELALGRLRSTVSRMKNKPDLMKQYDAILQDQLEKGVIEKVNSTFADGATHYLPHHAVVNPMKPNTKLRIVYDASAKSRKENKSLNECLYRGPVMLNDLCGLLMRFRLNSIAVVADIEKAFLQIGLQSDQRDVTRFIWIKDYTQAKVDSDNIQEYRFCRVPFGVISSPFLLGATIDSHLELYESGLATKLKDDIYVDNLITGTNSVEDAVDIYHGAKRIFKEASMNLREWSSNSHQLNYIFESNDRVTCDSVKVLGHTWNVESDTISLKKPTYILKSQGLTKRNVLKELASVFDPLGLVSPVLLKGKLFIQSLWSKHLNWDDAINSEEMAVWSTVSSDLWKLSDYQISRSIAVNDINKDSKNRLLCFCDASACAYATAVYLLQKSETSESKSDLLFSKTRLAPLKKMTIPRLELLAVLIGVRCVKFVESQLKILVEGIDLFTDSQCVLKWLRSQKDLSVFVRNRVKEINSHGDITFHYVKSNENPADIATRGTDINSLSENRLWWHGPMWLKETEEKWKTSVTDTDEQTDLDYDSEVKKQKLVKETTLLNTSEIKTGLETYSSGKCAPFGIECDRYSSLTKMIRVTALVIRFIRVIQNPKYEKTTLTSSELNYAETMWVIYIQKRNFSDVFEAISSKRPNNLQKQLGLYVDDDGMLRCKGRIDQASISESARRPVLLPKNEKFTKLLIERIHKQSLHSGVSQCLSQLRYRYWIPQGRATVRSVLKRCTVCRRHEGGPYRMPEMAPLPKTRITEAIPFSRTGLDYLGPMYIKTCDGQKKVWVCLFTCLVTRAIHLELIQDMSAEEFLLGFRRFISQRGCPSEIISDNALTFKTASKTLDLLWKNVIKCDDVQNYVSNADVNWRFIVELAPWMGGFYERLVSLVKRALRKTINRKLLTCIQLQTVLKEVEATVNARPLVYVSDDIDSTITLTPRHFLTLNPATGVPVLEYDNKDVDYNPYDSTAERLLQTWKKGQNLLKMFWRIWRNEYLLSLRERTQRKLKSGRIQSHFTPNVGDVVLVKDDLPRGCWRIGKVVNLVQSRDGYVRSAKVSMSSGRIIGRPINLLFPIEVSEDSKEYPVKDEKRSVSENEKMPIRHSVREAAKRTKLKIKESLSQ